MQSVAPIAVAVPSATTYDADVGRSRVLVLDEHDGSRAVMCQLLRMRGHGCWPALDSTGALLAVEALRPDVVLYEWCLRGGGGLGLAEKMRSASAKDGRVVRVAAVSVLTEPAGFRVRELVDAYFTKPVDMSKLHLELHL